MLESIRTGLASAFTRVHHATCGEDGQALVEYALIISLIAVVAIAALQATGTSIAGILNTIAGDL